MSYFTYFTSPSFVVVLIVFSSIIVDTILQKKVGKYMRHMIRVIIALPAIPLIWRMINEDYLNIPENIIFTFYLPLLLTIFGVLMLVYSIKKYNRNKSRREEEKNEELY